MLKVHGAVKTTAVYEVQARSAGQQQGTGSTVTGTEPESVLLYRSDDTA